MSGMTLLFAGLVFVIGFALVFFNFVSKRSAKNDAMVDRLIELNELTERKKMEKFMRDNDFYQVFQPFFDSGTGQIIGFEALTRLHGESKSDTMPESFLKKIREQDLFEKFDLFVFKKCCEWIKDDENGFFVTCNFSRTTLAADGTAAKIARIADQTGVKHSVIAIEILEDAIEDCDDIIRRNIAELKNQGFHIYLDDFGKPYTSISDLAAFHPDVIKIDKGMLDGISSYDGRRLLESMIKFVKEVGAKALCEGIETSEQADIVKKFGCDLLQGYHFCKPMRAEKPADFPLP